MNNFNTMNNNMFQQRQSPSYFNPALNSTTPTNNIIWVQGIEGAKAWQLNPNSMAILLDSEVDGKMYIKVSDNIGMSNLRIFNYVEEIPPTNKVTINQDLDLSEYVKKDELSSLIKEIVRNEQSLSNFTGEVNATSPSTTAAVNATKTVATKSAAVIKK